MACALKIVSFFNLFQTSELRLKGSEMDFNQPGFLYIEKRRPFCLQNILARYGNLIYTDIDTVWKKDPRPFLTGIYDFWGQVDGVLVGEPFFKWVYRWRKAK